MFGIGLPEMIVILAVALIVVGPDKLPELARSLARGMNEMKKTLNQVKENLSEETRAISSVQEDLKKTADQLTHDLLDDQSRAWLPGNDAANDHDRDEVDTVDLQPLEERPWERDANAVPKDDAVPETDRPEKTADSRDQTNAPADVATQDDKTGDSSAAA